MTLISHGISAWRQIAHYIGKPETTVRTAMKRLEAKGKVYQLTHGKYVVVAMADLGEDD